MGQREFDIPYRGYQPDVRPDIHVFFSTVAFRYAHSEINGQVMRMMKGDYGDFPQYVYHQLHQNFHDNRMPIHEGIGPIFVGMYDHPTGSMDNMFTDDIRNDLFRGHGPRVADLMAFDIQRARDHGIPKYNDMREAYGLERVKSFDVFPGVGDDDEIPTDEFIPLLEALYGHPDNCDAFICGLVEDWVVTNETVEHGDYSHIGALFEAALHNQFARVRDSDRLWYERQKNYDRMTALGLDDIGERTLADVIRYNVPGIVIGDNVFMNYEFLGIVRDAPAAPGSDDSSS